MQKTYQIKSTAIQNEQQLMDIAPAVGKAPASLLATPNARYELIDSTLKAAPDNIRVMRKGKNLFVFFEGDTAPGVVIENFYQVHTDNQPKLIGRTDQGTLYEYTPENAAPSALVSQLVDSGQSHGMVLGGAELADATGAVAGLLPAVGLSPWLIGAGALGAAAAAGGGGGGSSTSTGTPSAPNGGQALGLTIDADTNNDSAINATEKGSASTTSVSATFDKTKVAVGDTITFSDGTTTKSVVLTQSMLDAGKAVSTGWTLPSEGSSLNVTASLKNAVGNTTPVATDTAKIDTTLPNAGQALGLSIDADTNNDGAINATEKGSATTTSVSATFDKTKVAVGDTITFSDGTTTKVVTLTAADVAAGKAISTGWALPNEGSSLSVTASLKNTVGNTTPVATDTAKIDTTPPNAGQALGLTIDADTNNDGAINFKEKDNATTTSVSATFDKTKVAVGDTITFSDGTTTKLVTLTQTMLDAGKAVSTGWTLPNEGSSLSVTASLKNAVGNTTPVATDTAKIDTILPNGGQPPRLTVDADTNGDGLLSAAEIAAGHATTSLTATFDPNTVAVGDTITFSDGTTTKVVTLTAADVAAGKVTSAGWALPADGNTASFSASLKDAAGNPAPSTAQPIKTDATPPSNHDVALDLSITTDQNNDTWVNTTELNGKVTFSSRASFNGNAVVDDKIVFSASNGGTALDSQTHTLTQQDITSGFVDVTFAAPSNGALQKVTANYMDAAGNLASDASQAPTDSATLDTTAPSNADVNLAVTIATDTNNDGWVNTGELNGGSSLVSHATFNSNAVAGDKIVFSATNGGVALPSLSHILTQQDITAHFVDVSFAKPDEGTTQVVTANYVDAAGNASAMPVPSDSAKLDTVAAIIQSTPSVAAGHLNSLEFKSLSTESGHYTLNIGNQSFSSLPSASALGSIGTVLAKDVWLDFWDAAENQSVRAYLYDSASATQITIDANTHISVLMV